MPPRPLLLAALVLCPAAAAAQHEGHHPAADSGRGGRVHARVGLMAVGLVTRVSPAHAGRTLTEGYLTQPNVMAHAGAGPLSLRATVNLEGLVLRRGELNPGVYGEGYVDRRHPHTYLHELVLGARGRVGPVAGSVAAGRGFVPFGTDDPMMRPFVKFPVNHHHAQLLERALVSAGVRAGPLMAEAALFNGDEPTSPSDLPNRARYWDSRAVRVTALPAAGVELQGSHARVRSPEQGAGGGLDQRKSSASARWDRGAAGARTYAMAEWARTDDYAGLARAFRYESRLAEAAVERRRFDLALRLERTTRPEEERVGEDPFRSPVPHAEESIVGVTRWTTATVQLAAPLPGRVPRVVAGSRLFVEGALHEARAATTPSLFVPERFYGSGRPWTLSAGVRLRAGMLHRRMGRYGVADGGA